MTWSTRKAINNDVIYTGSAGKPSGTLHPHDKRLSLKKYKILCAINAMYNGNNKTVAPSVVFPFNLKT